jgi:hypothetical protein
MTTKEKAQAIFDKMYLVDDLMGNYPMCFDTAKKCALIAVDELIGDCDASSPFEVERLKYWNDVKLEMAFIKRCESVD